MLFNINAKRSCIDGSCGRRCGAASPILLGARRAAPPAAAMVTVVRSAQIRSTHGVDQANHVEERLVVRASFSI